MNRFSSHISRALLAGTLVAWPSLAAAQGSWGAIATSPSSGAWGSSFNYDSGDAARDRAQSECAKFAWDCRVSATFQNTCVTVARGANNAFGWAWGFTPAERAQRAIQECTNQGGSNCDILTRFCTGRQ